MTEVLNAIAHGFDTIRYPIGGLLCLIGALLALVGAIGVMRFPDFYTRLHASSVTDTSAVTLLLIGMAFFAPHWTVLLKLLAIGIFIFLTSPTSSHAIANAAHTAGVQPVMGRAGMIDEEDEL